MNSLDCKKRTSLKVDISFALSPGKLLSASCSHPFPSGTLPHLGPNYTFTVVVCVPIPSFPLMFLIRISHVSSFSHSSSSRVPPWRAACGDINISPVQGCNCCWIYSTLSLFSPSRCLTFVSATDRCNSRLLQLKQQQQPKQQLWLEIYLDLDQWEGSLQPLVRYSNC